MKTIVFEGYLKELYPNGITLEADSAAEAVLGLQNYPGFRKSDEVLHTVELPDFRSRDALYAPTLREEIRIVPVAVGAGGKKGGLIQVIIGAFLIVNAVFLMIITGGAAWPIAAPMAMVGASMLLGGLMALMMKTPKATSIAADEKSKYIPANRNTVKIGTPIPILYGRRKVWGHFLSFNVDAKAPGEIGDAVPFPPGPAPAIGPAIATATNPNNTVYSTFKALT